jgi:ribose 5-phosphate isomerase B
MYYIASDHAGTELKEHVVSYFKDKNIDITDLGPFSKDRVDYPDYAQKVANAVNEDIDNNCGILICGSGIGMSIAANKCKNIRATIARDHYDAYMARAHNDANILCMGERTTGFGTADDICDGWLSSHFEGGRHTGRVEKIMNIEKEEE